MSLRVRMASTTATTKTEGSVRVCTVAVEKGRTVCIRQTSNVALIFAFLLFPLPTESGMTIKKADEVKNKQTLSRLAWRTFASKHLTACDGKLNDGFWRSNFPGSLPKITRISDRRYFYKYKDVSASTATLQTWLAEWTSVPVICGGGDAKMVY